VELWWVFATLPFLLFPGRWAAWAVASLVLLWIMRWITTGRITARTPVDWPVLVLVLMLPVAVWVSGDLQMSLVAMYRLIGGIALFYAVVNWVSSGQRLVAATAMLALIGVGLAVLALLATTTWGLPKLFNPAPILAWLQIHVRPLIPEDINANVLGGGLALVWPVVAALLFGRLGESRRQTLWLRLGLAGSLLCMTPVLLLTQCQGALLGVAVAVAFMATLRWPRLRLCAALAGLAVLVWLARGGTGQLLQVADRLFSTSTGTSLSGRPEVWSASIHMVEDFPLTGIGLGTFDRVQALRYPFSLLHEQVHHAHNLLLAVAVDMGLPGAVAYLALLLGAVYTTWRTWQETRFRGESAFLNSLALGLLGGQTALLAHGMLDAAAWANKLAVIAWFMLGLTMAAGGLTADRPSPDPSPVEADA
jgi:putative inorganic carbon (HCO3(-)) transporter